MPRRLHPLVPLLLLSASVAAQDDPRLAAIAPLVEATIARHRLPGAVLLINQDGEPVYARAFGGYSLQTRLPIASASKWLSSTLVARLVAQGRLDWDATLAQHLPDVPADKATITLRQLFSMTSGLPGGDFGNAAPCVEDRATTLAACGRELLALPLVAPPGSAFDYGGNGMQLGGWLVERATGEDWNTLFRRELVEPLALGATAYALLPNQPSANPRIGGGVFASAPEYLKLVQLQLDDGLAGGRRLLDANGVAEQQRRHTLGTTTRNTPFPEAAGYGLGVWVDRLDARGQAQRISSPGAFGFAPWLERPLGVAAVFATQGNFSQMHADLFALQDAVAVALAKADPAPVPFADFGGIWWTPAEAGAGWFLAQRADDRLTLAWYTYADADGAQQWLLGSDGAWLASDRWRGVLYRTRHAAPGAIRAGVDPAAVQAEVVGSVELQFIDGAHAQLQFVLDGVERRLAIERFD